MVEQRNVSHGNLLGLVRLSVWQVDIRAKPTFHAIWQQARPTTVDATYCITSSCDNICDWNTIRYLNTSEEIPYPRSGRMIIADNFEQRNSLRSGRD